jgi:hypothetical protein
MSGFDRHSRVLDVVQAGPDAREVLLSHGYNLGEGFVDVLSQYQSLDDASREGRLRDLEGLLAALNSTYQK